MIFVIVSVRDVREMNTGEYQWVCGVGDVFIMCFPEILFMIVSLVGIIFVKMPGRMTFLLAPMSNNNRTTCFVTSSDARCVPNLPGAIRSSMQAFGPRSLFLNQAGSN